MPERVAEVAHAVRPQALVEVAHGLVHFEHRARLAVHGEKIAARHAVRTLVAQVGMVVVPAVALDAHQAGGLGRVPPVVVHPAQVVQALAVHHRARLGIGDDEGRHLQVRVRVARLGRDPLQGGQEARLRPEPGIVHGAEIQHRAVIAGQRHAALQVAVRHAQPLLHHPVQRHHPPTQPRQQPKVGLQRHVVVMCVTAAGDVAGVVGEDGGFHCSAARAAAAPPDAGAAGVMSPRIAPRRANPSNSTAIPLASTGHTM